ncbi:MAG: hypothetical protein ABSB67_00990 [Bryobacteraceae bacterium]
MQMRLVLLLLLVAPLFAADPDYSGIWRLNAARSELQSMNEPAAVTLRIEHRGVKIHCTALPSEGTTPVSWDYTTDQKEARYKIGDTSRNSRLKWEGDALLVNTLVNARDRSYTVMDFARRENAHHTAAGGIAERRKRSAPGLRETRSITPETPRRFIQPRSTS